MAGLCAEGGLDSRRNAGCEHGLGDGSLDLGARRLQRRCVAKLLCWW